MLRPQQQQVLLRPDQLPVFGKPWFWHRSASSMEISRSLAQVIVEMQEEIKKLEAENQHLRGKHVQRGFGQKAGPLVLEASPSSSSSSSAVAAGRWALDENLAVNLRRNVSAPLLEGQYKGKDVMTVRRYSVSSQLSDMTLTERRTDRLLSADSGWRRLKEEFQLRNHGLGGAARGGAVAAGMVRGDIVEVNSRHLLQEYVHKNRSKVKTVTFLLPVDDIYTNRPVLRKHQEEPTFSELESITETDS